MAFQNRLNIIVFVVEPVLECPRKRVYLLLFRVEFDVFRCRMCQACSSSQLEVLVSCNFCPSYYYYYFVDKACLFVLFRAEFDVFRCRMCQACSSNQPQVLVSCNFCSKPIAYDGIGAVGRFAGRPPSMTSPPPPLAKLKVTTHSDGA